MIHCQSVVRKNTRLVRFKGVSDNGIDSAVEKEIYALGYRVIVSTVETEQA